jgi:hypothetical protein
MLYMHMVKEDAARCQPATSISTVIQFKPYDANKRLNRLRNSGHVWLEVLKFNEHYITFVLFDKKFSILD